MENGYDPRPVSERGPVKVNAAAVVMIAMALVIVAALLVAGAWAASAAPATDRPAWMVKTCRTEDSVNCYWPGGSFRPDQGRMYVRRMPGTRLVCVMYVDHPRRDYCEGRR